MQGSCFSFVFLCRVHSEFSIPQYFLKLFLENSATLVKLFKADGATSQGYHFCFGGAEGF